MIEVMRTRRLVLRQLHAMDAAFIFKLVNDPSWLRYIGDRGVRSLEDAERYIADGPVAAYASMGFGLHRVELATTGEPIGMCGFVKRESLEHVDLGFALLPQYRGQGYAAESAASTLSHGKRILGLSRVLAIASQDNSASIRLLGKLGFQFDRLIVQQADAVPLALYSTTL